MTNLPLRYLGYSITFQEVPDEVSLVFNISGCPHKCEGCHSKYLWEYDGEILLNDIDSIIKQYEGKITCVCFMGGDQNIEELIILLQTVKFYGYKTCVYSGLNEVSLFDNILIYLDYLKIGDYKRSLGGLDSPKTNQKFYRIEDNKKFDITNTFYKKHKQDGGK